MRTLLHRLRFLLPRSRVRLGIPIRLRGDVQLSFRGRGAARFRIQHTRDRYGKPDEFGWCDVSAMSNGKIGRESAVDLKECRVHGLIVDYVNGNQDVAYRHYSAAWLRVIPFDDEPTTLEQCARYAVRVRAA